MKRIVRADANPNLEAVCKEMDSTLSKSEEVANGLLLRLQAILDSRNQDKLLTGNQIAHTLLSRLEEVEKDLDNV